MNQKMTIDSQIDGDIHAVGIALKQQREKLGLDIAECADSLKITNSKVIALEAGERSAFGAELFLRGYIKNYARLVNISEEEILHIYNAQHNLLETMEVQEPRPKKKIWWLPYLFAAVIVAVWFYVSGAPKEWGQYTQAVLSDDSSLEVERSEYDESSSTALASVEIEGVDANDVVTDLSPQLIEGLGAPPEEAVLVDALIVDGDSLLSNNVDVSSVPSLGDADVVADDIPEAPEELPQSDLVNNIPATELIYGVQPVTTVALADAPSAELATTAARPDILLFSFSENCWIRVVDASGDVIISRLQPKGSRKELVGLAPFTVTFGNVSGASLRLNGDVVSLGEGSSNGTLRITVGS